MALAKDVLKDKALPIVIAGGGCVGLLLALLLAHTSIPNHILVIEAQHPESTSTRAMAHQPPTYPILSQIPGLLPELIKAGSLSSGLCFRTSVANGSKVIASKEFDNSGEGMKGKGQLLLPQGKFQRVLMDRLAKLDTAEVRIGWSVTSFTQSASHVSVQLSSPTEDSHSVDAAYLIGADGAHSLVRKTMDVALEGETLDAQLVATDLRFPFKAHGFFDANFIIDSVDYGLIGRIDNDGLWRVSYGVPGDQSEEDIRAGVTDKLRNMLPDQGKDAQGKNGFEIVRIAPYRAQQRCATTFVQGRVCLVGDAAHLTNPYAGLGLASGIADADALAPILAHILTHKAASPSTLLASWSDARRQKFKDVVDAPSRMAYRRVRSSVGSEEEVRALRERDPLVGGLGRGMPVLPPSLRTVGEGLVGW